MDSFRNDRVENSDADSLGAWTAAALGPLTRCVAHCEVCQCRRARHDRALINVRLTIGKYHPIPA